jgi:hypothetical protein
MRMKRLRRSGAEIFVSRQDAIAGKPGSHRDMC